MVPERTATGILHTDAFHLLANDLDGIHHVGHDLVGQLELGIVLMLWESEWVCLGPAQQSHHEIFGHLEVDVPVV